MGFTNIFIIDPTCRALERYKESTGNYNDSNAVKSLRRIALSVIESQKPRTNSIPNFSYSASKYNNTSNFSYSASKDNTNRTSDKGIFERCLGDYCPEFLKNSKKTKARGKRVKNPQKTKTLKKTIKGQKKSNKK
jgi:transglutaminase/protease-like cytokinesis protein 3